MAHIRFVILAALLAVSNPSWVSSLVEFDSTLSPSSAPLSESPLEDQKAVEGSSNSIPEEVKKDPEADDSSLTMEVSLDEGKKPLEADKKSKGCHIL